MEKGRAVEAEEVTQTGRERETAWTFQGTQPVAVRQGSAGGGLERPDRDGSLDLTL